MSTYTIVMKLAKVGSEVSHFDYRSRSYRIHHAVSRIEILFVSENSSVFIVHNNCCTSINIV
jgi:hypothetical protein